MALIDSLHSIRITNWIAGMVFDPKTSEFVPTPSLALNTVLE